jgi:hypothetical protein
MLNSYEGQGLACDICCKAHKLLIFFNFDDFKNSPVLHFFYNIKYLKFSLATDFDLFFPFWQLWSFIYDTLKV